MTIYTPNPDNYPTSLTVVDDSTPPNATEINTPTEGLADQVAYLAARSMLGLLTSLQPAENSGGPFIGAGPYAFCWNDRPFAFSSEFSAQAWLVTGYSGGITVWWTMGTDGTWTQIGGGIATGNPANDIDVSAATGTIWVVTLDTAHIITYKCVPAGSFALVGNDPITTCTDAQLAKAPSASGSAMYIAAGSSTAGDARLGFTTDAGSTSYTGTFTATHWLLESNGSYGLAIPKQAATSQQAYKSNASGSVWTGSTIGIGNTDVPISLAWNAVRGLWMLAVSVAGGVPTAFYTSPDGATWTLTSTLTTVNTGGAVAACGPFFFFLDNDSSSPPHMRLMFSVDGAITWFPAPARLVGTASSNIPRIIAAPHMLALAPAVDPTVGMPTNSNIRFSLSAGKGDAPVT